MTLAAFGASAQTEINPTSISPKGGTDATKLEVVVNEYGELAPLSSIIVAFPDTLYFREEKKSDTVKVALGSMKKGGLQYDLYATILDNKNGSSVLMVPLDADGNPIELTEPDSLAFFLPGGTLGTKEWVSDNTKGKVNADVSAFYLIPEVLKYVEVSPASAVLVDPMTGDYEGGVIDTLKKVTITFVQKAYLAEGKSSVEIQGQGILDWGTYEMYSSRIDLADDGMSATVTPIGTNGQDTTLASPGSFLQVIIPASTFGDEAFSKGEVESVTNTDWGFMYQIPADDPSVDSTVKVEAAAEGVTVYNLQGVLVLKSDDAAVLNTLESGLYIVNGKKVIIVK